MGYTAPAAVSSGAVISKTTFGDVVIADLNFLANAPSCRVYHNAAQSIAHNSLVTLAFNSERHDNDTMHDTVTNNSRITIKTAGVYVVTLNAEMATATDYTRIMAAIRLGGATYLAFTEVGTTTQSDVHRISLATIYKFAVNDYVEAQIQHVNGAAAARNCNSAGNSSPEFAATWVSLG